MLHFGIGGTFGYPREETRTTKFYCEKCGKSFEIAHEIHVGLFELIAQIPQAHREASAECEYDADRVRVTKSL